MNTNAFKKPLEGGLAALADSRLRIDPLGTTERQRIVAGLFHEGARRLPFLHRFYSLMTLSVLIAVLGLIADSTAVVIGAMLVAPLMAPVLGIAAALVMDWSERALWSLWVAATGAMMAIAIAALVSWLMPGDPTPLPNELLSRTSPRLVDLGVALVAGSAGAYSHVRSQAGDAIVGVAVAVALIPPLAVVGVTLEMGEWQMAAGSFLLFLANVIGIITAGALTFILFGLVPKGRLFETRQPIARRLRTTVIATVLVVAPLQIIDEWRPTPVMSSAPGQALVTEVVSGWRADVRVISIAVHDAVEGESAAPQVHLTLAKSGSDRAPLGVDVLANRISEAFGSSVNVVVTSVESNVETAETLLEENEPQPETAATTQKGK